MSEPEALSSPTVIGWREWVALPEWGVAGIRAKIDTGARTCALDVDNLEVAEDGRLSFDVVLDDRKAPNTLRVTGIEPVRTVRVKSSTGRGRERHVVEARLRIGEREQVVEVGLVKRTGLQCRMLIGRTALDDFLVDPERTYLLTRRRRRASHRRNSPGDASS